MKIYSIASFSFLLVLSIFLSACDGSGSGSSKTMISYTIGGSVSGLSGNNLVLQNNTDDNLSISTNGGFTFAKVVVDGDNYAVSIAQQPTSPDQICEVSNGIGTVDGANVINISVICKNVYTVGGEVSGLTGSNLKLQNNAGDELSISTNGSFTFATVMIDGENFEVSIAQQPTSPDQICEVSNGSGTVSGTNISSVSVVCSNVYTIGGMVSGLASSGLILQNNIGDDLLINADGSFTFASSLIEGTNYNISILSRPNTRHHGCFVANGTGMVATANITDVMIQCQDLTGLYIPPTLLNYPQTVAYGDVDGDGDPDVVLGRQGRANLVLKNQGANIFVDSGQALGLSSTVALVMGDIDGDGDLDLVEGNGYGQSLVVWSNDGVGVFSDTAQNLSSNSTRAVLLGDVDNDGDLDLLVGIDGLQPNKIWLNNGAGQYTDSGQLLGNSETTSLAMGDLDNDGDLDFMEGIEGNSNKVWINDGSGNFTDSGQALGSAATQKIVLADVDGDNDLDAATANYNENNRIWINDGSGNFTDSGQTLGYALSNNSLVFGDVDEDNDLDLIMGNFDQPTSVWLNNSNGIFTNSHQLLGNGVTREVSLVDLDGDGDLDLGAVKFGAETDLIWVNNGGGFFTATAQGPDEQASTNDLALGDIDNDGDLDLVMGNYLGKNTVWLNDGAGHYKNSEQVFSTGDTNAVVLSDLDNDGDLDLVTGNDGSYADVSYLNDGNGVFTQKQAMGINSTRAVVAADLDGDNDIDLVFGSFTDGIEIMKNDGTGLFIYTNQFLNNSNTTDIALGDVDSDGDLDIVAGNDGGNANKVWLNDGTGIFSDSGQSLGTNSTIAISLADLDGDGDLDIVSGNSGGTGEADKIWFNDGSGQFSDSGQELVGIAFQYDLSVGDIDNDGDVDIVIAYYNYDGVGAIWLNDGSGLFTDSGWAFPKATTTSVVLGDLDNDGDLDILTGVSGLGIDRVYINQTH